MRHTSVIQTSFFHLYVLYPPPPPKTTESTTASSWSSDRWHESYIGLYSPHNPSTRALIDSPVTSVTKRTRGLYSTNSAKHYISLCPLVHISVALQILQCSRRQIKIHHITNGHQVVLVLFIQQHHLRLGTTSNREPLKLYSLGFGKSEDRST